MSGFDAPFILTQIQALAQAITDLGKRSLRYQMVPNIVKQQAERAVGPAVVAFLGQLSAGASGREEELQPVVARFFAAPGTAAALVRLAASEEKDTAALAETFRAAAMDEPPVSRQDFEAALWSFAAAYRESLRQSLAESEQLRRWSVWFVQLQPILAAMLTASDRDAEARELVTALRVAGVGHISEGRVYAADNSTVVFVWWHHGEMAESLPQAANGGGEAARPPTGEDLSGPSEETPVAPPMIEPPAPLPPAPMPPVMPVTPVALRLDAALPQTVSVGHEFILAAAIRRPGSPPLAERDLDRSESRPFTALWPADAPFIRLRIQVGAPECDIVGPDTQPMPLFAGQDGPTVYFRLIPRQVGPLDIIISVYQEMDWMGATRLLAEAVAAGRRAEMDIAITSRELPEQASSLEALRRVLDDHYNTDELKDLCLTLGIDYDDISGDNQSAKARELVLYMQRRGRVADLVELVMRERPKLLVAVP